MKTRWVLLVGVVVGASLLGLAATEAALRFTGLAAPPAVISVNESQFAKQPGVFVSRPTKTERATPRFPHRITVNSLGYRGTEISLMRGSTRESRIFFAGDSFTWGDLVDDHETVPARLETDLTRICPGTRVINAGVGGTTIDAHQEMIQRGLVLEPDLVLLMFYDNDIAEMDRPTFWEVMAENRRRKSRFPVSVVYSTLNRTAIWTVVRRAGTRLTSLRARGSPEARQERTDEFWESSIELHRHLYSEHFEALVGELSDREIPLVLVSFPAHLRVREPKGSFNHVEWLDALADGLGVPHLDLLPALVNSSQPLEDLYFVPWDGHARPVSNEIASEHISAFLGQLEDSLHWCRHSRTGEPTVP